MVQSPPLKNVHTHPGRSMTVGHMRWLVSHVGQTKVCINLFFSFDLILYVPSTIFQLERDRSSWV